MLHKQIVVKNQTGDEPLTNEELADVIISAVGIMSVEDKPTLVSMLQKNGSLVTDVNTQSEILDATFKSIRDSSSFRQDLEDYLVEQGTLADVEQGSSSFSNTIGQVFNKIGTGLKTVGKSIFTKENVQALSTIGIGYLGAKLQDKATKGQGQQAIDYTNAQANLEAIKLAQLQASQGGVGGGNLPTETKKRGWVLPVAIGGGVLVLGTILYFVLRKKK
jgi:hypothetical protein